MYVTFNVSPFETVFDPPVNAPAEYNVPLVLSIVLTAPEPKTRKQPPTVPDEPMANDKAAEVAFDPDDAADHATVLRGAV